MAVNPAYVKDVSLGHGLMERDAVPAGGGSSPPLPGVSGIMPVSTTTDTRGASLEVRDEIRRYPRRVLHEAWPEVSLWDGKSLG